MGLERDFAMLLTVRRHRRLSVRGELPRTLSISAGTDGFKSRPLPRLRNAFEWQCCIISVEAGWTPRVLFAKC